MPFTPSTTVYLLNVPIDATQENQLYFASAAAQATYFSGRLVSQFSNFSYQRKDNILKVPAHIDSLWNCNYCMYKNANYSNKWFYCFIMDMKYENDGCTYIELKTDVFQTWYFEKTLEQCFVEREHVMDDIPGVHTVPENLEKGDFISTGSEVISELNNVNVILGSTLSTGEETPRPGCYSGSPSSLSYNNIGTVSTFQSGLQTAMAQFSDQPDVIVDLFAAPNILAGTTGYVDNMDYTPNTVQKSVTAPTTVNGYVPRNQKLLCYPYCFLNVTNGAGNAATYQYEYFSNRNPSFTVYGTLTPGCSIRMIPNFYKGVASNFDEGLNLAKYPIFNWTSDQYTAWLAQNGVNVVTSLVGTAGGLATSIVAGAAVGGGGGAAVGAAVGVINAAGQVANSLNEVHKASLLPPQLNGNSNSGDIAFATGNINFHFYKMSIKQEFAQILDSYFDMYGYKVNAVKVPNTTGRPSWNYVKTIGCSITGAIPSADMAELKRIFDNGVTIWKNPSYVGDYSRSNVASA